MLSAAEVLDRYYLDARSMLLELAATLDRYDTAAARGRQAAGSDNRLQSIYRSLELLASQQAEPNRTERLLHLFSEPA